MVKRIATKKVRREEGEGEGEGEEGDHGGVRK